MGTKVINQASGKTGRIFMDTDGSLELCVEDITVTETGEEYEVTNSCSNGYDEYEYGNTHLEGSVTATYDADINVFATDPPNLTHGASEEMWIYLNEATGGKAAATGPYCHAPTMRIMSPSVTIPAKGKVTYTFNFKSNGEYTWWGSADVS